MALLLSSVLLLKAGVHATLTTSSPAPANEELDKTSQMLLRTEKHTPTPVPVTVTVDATTSGAGATPFPHKWKRSFGSGHASLSLRSDWRKHLKQAHDELGLSGVRYHGLFDDDMSVVPAPGVYNFTSVGNTWDYLLKTGVTPIVELSFMPAFVANCTWHGHCKQDRKGCTGYWCTQCSGHGVGPIVNPHAPANCTALEFWYQGIKQVPYNNDYGRWYDLVKHTVTFAVKRYGLAEVQKWSFEVWNELWGLRWPDQYMALYNASARAIKAVDPSLRVGGPATAALAHVADFVAECENGSIPYDFVSTHHYPTDSCPKGPAWDPDCFNDGVLKNRQTVSASTPYLLTEYNVGCCLGYVGHEIATAAAFVFRSVGALNEDLDVYSYWTFTDVFEEGGLNQIEFKNVYGAMSVSGVPKPVWRAFQLLHEHAGTRRLPTSISNQTRNHSSTTPTAAAPPSPPPKKQKWAVAVACNASDPAQTGWSFDGGALQWKAADGTAFCIDSIGGADAMELTPCVYLQPSQTFAQKGSAYEQGSKCLDVFLPDPTAERRVDLYACNGGDNQKFSIVRTEKALESSIKSLRVFLSFWSEPLATPDPLLADRDVLVYVNHDAIAPAATARAGPTHATLYTIDDEHVNPFATWKAMGSPDKPNATQLDQLMLASSYTVTKGVAVTAVNATTSSLHVRMPPNSVAVVEFDWP